MNLDHAQNQDNTGPISQNPAGIEGGDTKGTRENVSQPKKPTTVWPDEHMIIDQESLLKDCSSVSHSIFGHFVPSLVKKDDQQQLAILRSNDTIELYRVVANSEQLQLVCKYSVSSGVKIQTMICMRKPGTSIDWIVIQVPKLKFITLQFDETTNELETVCLHNFEQDERLQASGKVNPRVGFLQSFFTTAPPIQEDFKTHHEGRGRPRKEKVLDAGDELYSQVLSEIQHKQNFDISGFLFLADDTKVVVVQFKPQDECQKHYFCSEMTSMTQEQLLDQLKTKDQDNFFDELLRKLQAKQGREQMLYADYMDVCVPQKTRSLLTGNFKVTNHRGFNEFLIPEALKAQDLLFPSQVYDLVSLQASGSDGPEFSNYVIRQSELIKKVGQMQAIQARKDELRGEGESQGPSMQFYHFENDLQMDQDPKLNLQRISGPGSKVYAIKDLKVVASSLGAANNSPIGENPGQGGSLNLFVLHQSHLDKCICTMSKPECMELNKYSLNLLRAVRQYVKPERDLAKWTGQPIFNFRIVRMGSLELTQQVERLNFYTRSIVSMQDQLAIAYDPDSSDSKPKNDLLFLISNVSIYAFRQERQTITEVQTSSIAKIIEDLNANERHQEKIITSLPEEEKGQVPQLKAQNVINKKDLELRFDGCTRFVALPNNRLLIIMENQTKIIVHFRFDQADLDVAAVDFVKCEFRSSPDKNLSHTPAIIPASVCVSQTVSKNTLTGLNRYANDFLVFVSSYFNDQVLCRLQAQFGEEFSEFPEKRQRLLSADSAAGSNKDFKKRQTQINQMLPDSYDLQHLDSLSTLSPINNISTLGNDLLISSGHFLNSSLTIVKQGDLAVDRVQQMLQFAEIKDVFTLSFEQVCKGEGDKELRNLDQFILLTFEGQEPRIWQLTTAQLREYEYAKFMTRSLTASQVLHVQKVGADRVVLVSQKIICLIRYKFETKEFETEQVFTLQSEERVIKSVVGVTEDLVFTIEEEGGQRSLLMYELRNLQTPKSLRPRSVLKASLTRAEDCLYIAALCLPDRMSVLKCSFDGQSVEEVWISSQHQRLFRAQAPIIYSHSSSSPNKSGLHRSSTDLTVELNKQMRTAVDKVAAEMALPEVREMALTAQDRDLLYLTLVYETGEVLIYQMQLLLPTLEHNFFKLVKRLSIGQKLMEGQLKIYQHDNQQIICQEEEKPIVVTFRSGRVIQNRLPFAGMFAHAQIEQPVKPNSVKVASQSSPFFLSLIKDSEIQETSLVMCKHAPLQYFDVKQQSLFSDGVALKRFSFEGKGIKAFCLHQDKFLVVATFQRVQTVNAPSKITIDQGWNPNLKNMAQDFKYQVEVYQLPSFYHSTFRNHHYKYHFSESFQKTAKPNWKEMTMFQKMLSAFTDLQLDEIISNMKSLSLDVGGERKEFLIMATIKLEKGCEKTFYGSCLYFMQMTPSGELKCMCQLDQKKLISSLQEYRGKLLSVQKSKQDFEIVIQQLKLNSTFNPADQLSSDPSQYQFKFTLDSSVSQWWQPQTIQNMCNFISIEQDYIMVGDIYKNFQVFKLKDTEELKKEKQENSDIITLKKRFQSKMDSHCVGVWPFNVLKDSETHLSQSALFSADQNGLLRIYAVRGTKNLENIGILDLKDQILKIMPIVDEKKNSRTFAILTKRSGIVKVRAVQPQQFMILEMLANKMSNQLPFGAGFPPSQTMHLSELEINPTFLNCSMSLASLMMTHPRMNPNNALDARSLLPQFDTLSLPLKFILAMQLGFQDQNEEENTQNKTTFNAIQAVNKLQVLASE